VNRGPQLEKKLPLAPSGNAQNERVSREWIRQRLQEMWLCMVYPEHMPAGGITDETVVSELKTHDDSGEEAVAPSLLLLQALEHCFGIDPGLQFLSSHRQYDMGNTVFDLINWIYWEVNR
jgi:hypothetical protein